MAVLSTMKPSRKDLDRFIKLYSSHRPVIQRFLTVGFSLYIILSSYRSISGSAKPTGTRQKGKGKEKSGEGTKGKQPRVAVSHITMIFWCAQIVLPSSQVDAVFYERLRKILKIVIPSLHSKEALLLFQHSSLLIFRTAISLYVAALDGKYVPPGFSSYDLY